MKKENFLDWVLIKNPVYEWKMEEEIVTILIPHKKIFDRFAQKFFHKPKVSYVSLEEYGSFLWKNMDGEKTIGDLAELLRGKYQGAAEPLYPRITQYMRILLNNHFVKRNDRS